MTLNLLRDRWIPVRQYGEVVMVSPDRIAAPGVSELAWPRPDFNLACLELLIGLVSLTYPPEDDAEWKGKLENPDVGQLRERMELFSEHFQLGGSGPRFLQDLEVFERDARPSDIKPVDMLFIDSAGSSTVGKNADLMVKRNRFSALEPAEAAMALYTLQAFAPSGGAGNRTSMRGGGPMTTLVRPVGLKPEHMPLWRLVFSNVFPRTALPACDAHKALPWLRPTRTSEKHEVVEGNGTHPLEVFFGMPRRLRLVFDTGQVTGVIQRPYGTNYSYWVHPLTPYFRRKEDDLEWLPVHPGAGRLSYRNWLGINLSNRQNGTGTRRIAQVFRAYNNRPNAPECELLVGGWAMDNMKPVDFTLDTYPSFPSLDEDGKDRVQCLVEAANAASGAVRRALKVVCLLDGTSLASLVEAFFAETEEGFVASVRRITDGGGREVEEDWYSLLTRVAGRVFDEQVLTGLVDHDVADIEKRVMAKRNLHGELARRLRSRLNLPPPGKKERRT